MKFWESGIVAPKLVYLLFAQNKRDLTYISPLFSFWKYFFFLNNSNNVTKHALLGGNNRGGLPKEKFTLI